MVIEIWKPPDDQGVGDYESSLKKGGSVNVTNTNKINKMKNIYECAFETAFISEDDLLSKKSKHQVLHINSASFYTFIFNRMHS